MSLYTVSASLIISGSILFLVAAFSPIAAVFAEQSAPRKLEIIGASPNAWFLIQVLFDLGALLTALGIAVEAYHLHDRSLAGLMVASVVLLLLGFVCWICLFTCGQSIRRHLLNGHYLPGHFSCTSP